jgi:antitoxin component YwqK of YwqJK toxin-antitoxin module
MKDFNVLVLFVGLFIVGCQSPPIDLDLETQNIELVDGIILYYGIPYTGEGITYHDNGKVKSTISFKEGLPHGRWRFYYSNGNLESHESWFNGIKGGPFRWYYPNGQLKSEVVFEGGKVEGEWVYYNEDGELEKTEIYKDGKLIK